MSVQRCKKETTSMDFVMWMEYLEQEANAFHREDYYMAQIAAEVFRGNAKNPKKVRLRQFLLKFEREKKAAALTKEERLLRSKQAWCASVGLSSSKRKKSKHGN